MKRRIGVLALGVLLGAGLMAVVQQQPHAAASAEAFPVKTAVGLERDTGTGNNYSLFRLWSDGTVEMNTHGDLGWKGWQPLQ